MQLDDRRRGLACTMKSLVSGIFALLTFAATGSVAAEPYSVEDLIHHRWVGPVRFTPDGAGVVIEHVNSASDHPELRPQLFWSDLRGGGNGRALFSQAPEEGYASFSPSPDSRYAAYVRYHGDALSVAVYDFQTRRSTEFDGVPNEGQLTWISDHEVMFSTVSPGAPPSSFIGQMSLQWRKMQEGKSTTASAMGSGRYATRPESSGSEGIVIADIRTGATRLIGPGRFLDQAVSPSGTWLVAIRRVPAILSPRLPLVQFDERGPLVVFDLKRDRAERAIGDSHDVVPGSLRWSPSGRRLAFLTDGGKGSADPAQLWTYDAVNGTAHRVELGGLSASQPNSWPFGSPLQRKIVFAWLGEELTVMAQAPAVPPHAVHTNWFLLRSGVAPINLTAQFDGVPELGGITRDSLLMSADGQVWEVWANQKRRLLATNLGKRVRVRPRAFPDSISLPTSSVVLEDEPSQGPKTVYFLDVASDRITGRVTAPAADAEIKAMSLPAKRVAFRYRQDNADIIAVADASGASRDILRLNEFLKDKEVGTFIKIDHTGSKNGQKLTSWLLLPPGYRNGSPLPTVVHIYPGITYDLTPPSTDPYSARAFLLAARGYAVLFASLPVDRSVLPRDPLPGLADAVLLAVDAAIARGYVDGNRLAVQGQSFGGYGTLAVIGQTDRFKAAVAVAGVYDLISMYGQPSISERLTQEFDGIGINTTVLPLAWSETGALGAGVPPWNDSQRYLRNSPLLHVDTIHTPVMLVHGDLDDTAPFTQSEEMFTALYRLNKDAVFVRYWGETHSVPTTPANIRDYWTRIYAWYDTHLGPPFDVAKALSR